MVVGPHHHHHHEIDDEESERKTRIVVVITLVTMVIEIYAGIVTKSMGLLADCLLYTSPSPRDVEESRMPSSA